MRRRVTAKAERDLKDIFHYTYRTFGPSQAEAYLRELDNVFAIIGDYPQIGRPYEGATHQFVHGKHLILYRIVGQHVVIGRIFHGAQSQPKRKW